MEASTLSTAAQNAFQIFGQVYVFIYNQLGQLNIPMPPPDRVFIALSNLGSALIANAPPALRQFYANLAQLPIQSNLFAIIAILFVLYIVYNLIMATVRSIVRMVYGFIRFTFIVVMLVSCLVLLSQYYEIPFLQDFLGVALQQQLQQQRPPSFVYQHDL
ncbi:hypothetical protein K492DRAFT_144149 [Lichtheimia hyalospora FSU 10163]|nr:hypothetical protein K492DRAFT_144149 [Lichtheimia hyalospora FSU 10163]